jgi:hypothetical protein
MFGHWGGGQQQLHRRLVDRLRIQPALHPVQPQLVQCIALLNLLDALGHDFQPEGARQATDRRDDRMILRLVGQPGDEAAIDLEGIDREPAQVRQSRIAGAEVVDGQADAQSLQAFHRVQRDPGIAQQRGLGDLQAQLLRRQSGFGQRGGDFVDRIFRQRRVAP